MKALKRFDAGLAKIEEVLLFVMLIGLILVASLQVVWRNLLISTFGSPKLWIDELLGHMTFFVGLTGAALASHADKHIRIDVLDRFLPRGRVRMTVRLVTAVATVAICAVLTKAAWAAAMDERLASGEIAEDALLASWHAMMAIPIAFGLLCLHFTLHAIVDLVYLIQGVDPGEGKEGA